MATVCLSADFRDPRAWGRGLVWAAGYVLFRLALGAFAPLPGVLFLDPIAVALFLVLRRCQGPGGLLLLLGMAVADLAAQVYAPLLLLRLLVLSPWPFLTTKTESRGRDAWQVASQLACIQGAVLCWTDNWSFLTLTGLTLFQSVLWICLLLPLVRAPRSPGLPFWILLASFGLCALMGDPFPPDLLGDGSPLMVRVFGSLLALGLLLPFHRIRRLSKGKGTSAPRKAKTAAPGWEQLQKHDSTPPP